MKMQEIPLPRAVAPHALIDPARVRAMLIELEQTGMEFHNLMLVKGGEVVFEKSWSPFASSDLHILHSVSKSFTSTAVGFAIAEGLLDLDDRVIDLFRADLPEGHHPGLEKVTLRHLLTMSVGHQTCAMGALSHEPGANWAKQFLSIPLIEEPGTRFEYNTAATYMAGRAVQIKTGLSLLEYLRPRLFDPLGIGEVRSLQCPQGFDVGGFGMSMTVEAIAKLGVLYSQDGIWNGARVLPIGWASQAVAKQISNGDEDHDWAMGYGFQFWRSCDGAWRADGAFGQLSLYLPSEDLIVAVTANLFDLGKPLTIYHRHLIQSNPVVKSAPIIPRELKGKWKTEDGELEIFSMGDQVVVNHSDGWQLRCTSDGQTRVRSTYYHGDERVLAPRYRVTGNKVAIDIFDMNSSRTDRIELWAEGDQLHSKRTVDGVLWQSQPSAWTGTRV